MSEEGVLIPTVAPGQWRTAMQPDGTQYVTATFAGGRDAAAVDAQLKSWLRALGACVQSAGERDRTLPIALPRRVAVRDGALTLEFLAPRHIGSSGLPATREPQAVLDLLARLAAGLDALHASNLVHGGLGMWSIWWMPDGTLQLPDAALTHALEHLLPAPTEAAGYRAPEVWRGRSFVPASDQYALAVMAFELFSGRKRVVQENDDRVVSIEPMVLEPSARLYDGAPAALNDVLQRALSASPGGRYASCTEFIEALAGHVENVRSMPTMHRASREGGSRTASRRVMALGAVAMASVATAAVVLKGSIHPASIPRGLPSLPRIDASVLPSVSSGVTGQGGVSVRMPGAMPSSSGGGASPGVRGALPQASSASSGVGTVASGTANGVSPDGAAPGTMQRGRISTDLPPVSSPASSNGASGSVSSLLPRIASGGTATGSAAASIVDRAARSARQVVSPSSAPRAATSPPPVSAPVAVQSSAGVIDERPVSPSATPARSDNASRATTPAMNSAAAPSAVAAPSTTGTLALSIPSGARVYVDGVFARPTGNRLAVPAGSHDVDIVMPNGARTRRRVSVARGETVAITTK